MSEGHTFLAALGIIFTGVAVPFLGVWGMLLYKGDLFEFFQCFGKKGTLLFAFSALALMGPFGVLARCLTVAHGALVLLFPDISLYFSSALLCAAIFFLAVNKSKIVTTLGSILTPFLLLSIGVIAWFGLTEGSMPAGSPSNSWEALKNGFFQGYQTMDLLAAFFFSQFVIQHLKERIDHFYPSSLLGAGLLSAVYLSLVMLGWKFSPMLEGAPPQEMLGMIAMESLGSFAAPCVCLAIVFACLTTAIVLASLFADFVRTEIAQDKLGNPAALLLTLGISFAVSTLDFAGIAAFLGPLLETIYPALITLTVINIGSKIFGYKATHWPFTLTLITKLLWV